MLEDAGRLILFSAILHRPLASGRIENVRLGEVFKQVSIPDFTFTVVISIYTSLDT